MTTVSCTKAFDSEDRKKAPACGGIDETLSLNGWTASHRRRPPAAKIRRRRSRLRPLAGRCRRRVALGPPSARPHRYYCEFCGVLPFIADKTLPWKGRWPCSSRSRRFCLWTLAAQLAGFHAKHILNAAKWVYWCMPVDVESSKYELKQRGKLKIILVNSLRWY